MSRFARVFFGILAGILLITLIAGAVVSVYSMFRFASLGPGQVLPEGQNPEFYRMHPRMMWGPGFGFLPCLGFAGFLLLTFLIFGLCKPRPWRHWQHGPWHQGRGYWQWHEGPPPGGGDQQAPPPPQGA